VERKYDDDNPILVDNDWYEYYKGCEESLKAIKKIMQKKEFSDFYDDKTDHFQFHIIDIYNHANCMNPIEREEFIDRVIKERDRDK